ncbi:hypothetical protein [Kitasatospora sp. NPDC001095]
MSMIKTFLEDTNTLRAAATEVAAMQPGEERAIALTQLFASCGELSLTYACPSKVIGLLVGVVSEAYGAERKRLGILPNLEVVA